MSPSPTPVQIPTSILSTLSLSTAVMAQSDEYGGLYTQGIFYFNHSENTNLAVNSRNDGPRLCLKGMSSPSPISLVMSIFLFFCFPFCGCLFVLFINIGISIIPYPFMLLSNDDHL